jgi:hypothetical protein
MPTAEKVAARFAASDKPDLREVLDEYEWNPRADYEWTNRRSRYRKGQKVMVLDDTGYHDSTITVMSPYLIKSRRQNQLYLLGSESGGRYVGLHPVDRQGVLEGEES